MIIVSTSMLAKSFSYACKSRQVIALNMKEFNAYVL